MSGVKKIPALGQALEGDWRRRIYERLAVRECTTVIELAELHPVMSLTQLADELSTDWGTQVNRSDVAPSQVGEVWRIEAEAAGGDALERMARRMLAGQLHRYLTDGWEIVDGNASRAAAFRLSSANTSWRKHLDGQLARHADAIFATLLADGRAGRIPRGWLPASADDPVLSHFSRVAGAPSEQEDDRRRFSERRHGDARQDRASSPATPSEPVGFRGVFDDATYLRAGEKHASYKSDVAIHVGWGCGLRQLPLKPRMRGKRQLRSRRWRRLHSVRCGQHVVLVSRRGVP